MLLSAKKEHFIHSLMPLIKALLLEILQEMEQALDTSLNKVSKCVSLNLSQRLWVFMEKDAEHFTLSAKTKELQPR